MERNVTGHRLIKIGIVLFLIGLLTGFAVPLVNNPRMGLASHMQGIINGIVLVMLGIIWPRLRFSRSTSNATLVLVIYGTFANWLATLLAAAWGAGRSMPIAALGKQGSALQETAVDLLLFSLSFAMIAVSGLVLWGLRGGPEINDLQ